MATATTPNLRLSSLPPAVGQAGLRGAIASEFTKIRSVRSTYWTLGALFIVSVGLSIAITAGTAANFANNPGNKAGFDATQTSLGAFFELGQLIIAVIGAMVITSEYSTGMIRTSLTAQPRRGVVYAAKAIVFTAVTLVISLITSFVAFFVGQAMLSGKGVAASLFHNVTIPATANMNCNPNSGCTATFFGTDVIHSSTVLTAIIGCALFVTIVALISFGIGSIVRHTAGAIAAVIALMFIVPILEHTLPEDWRNDIMRFLPDAANQVVSATITSPGDGTFGHLWSAWPQLGVTALWAVALVGVGAYFFRKRDA
jgi:ABC-2 type transport system permease protein